MPTAAEVIIRTLAASGVQRIYGWPDDSLNGITDSICKTPGKRCQVANMPHVTGQQMAKSPWWQAFQKKTDFVGSNFATLPDRQLGGCKSYYPEPHLNEALTRSMGP